MNERTESKAYEIVQSYVMEMYANHKLQPGDIIFETVLAEELGLSRTPVRDALGRLSANRFLEQYPGKRGYYMPLLTFQDMHDAFEARECLEEKIGWLAAEKAQKKDLLMLTHYNNQEVKFYNESSNFEYMKANDSFHLELAHIANNEYIEHSYKSVYWRTQIYVYYLGPFINEEKKLLNIEDYSSDTPHEHAHIIEAISNRDSQAAAKTCLEHIRSTFTNRLSKQYSCPADLFEKLLKLEEK